MKARIIKITALVIIFATIYFYSYDLTLVKNATFTKQYQDSQVITNKYDDVWDDTTIKEVVTDPISYEDGDIIGTITIPGMDIYELPIVYGTSEENKNWQVTALSQDTNWSMVGETGITAIGAHNYQLFTLLPTLRIGEKFIIETPVDTYVYEIIDRDIYNEGVDDWEDLVWKGRENNSVNLITCYPVDEVATPDRMIVFTKMQKGTIILLN